MLSVDPLAIARRQLELDEARTARFEHLLSHKVSRMVVSPLAFLRGSAPMFYALLDRHPSLSDGPRGEGWLVGDAHLENFGAYRTGALSLREGRDEDRIVFDINDFDDAVVGPWRFDVLRLVTSVVVGGREIGADGPRALELCDALIDSYVGAAFHNRRAPPTPRAVSALVEQVRGRTRKQLLAARTEVEGGRRRFIRGPHFQDLPRKVHDRVERAFAKYARRLPDPERPPDEALEILDAAFRIAGTGSLGCLRLGVLVRGKGGVDGAWIFDVKEQRDPSAACLLGAPRLRPAERVSTAIRECLAHPPRMMGTTRLRGSSMFVRRLAPQEDRLDLAALPHDDLEPVVRHLGWLLGSAHRRGKVRAPKEAWGAEDRRRIVRSAIALAGIHEAAYLAYCDLARQRGLGGRAGKPAAAKSPPAARARKRASR